MSKWGLFCLQKRWLGRATGIIFQHIKSQWQEGGKLLSMSTADRRKNNELKLQQEKVRKDIRKNFLGKKKKKGQFCTVSITAGHQIQLRQTYFRHDKSVEVLASEQADGLSDELAAQSNHHHVQPWKTWHKRASTGKAAWQRDQINGRGFMALQSCTPPMPGVTEQSLTVQDYI